MNGSDGKYQNIDIICQFLTLRKASNTKANSRNWKKRVDVVGEDQSNNC